MRNLTMAYAGTLTEVHDFIAKEVEKERKEPASVYETEGYLGDDVDHYDQWVDQQLVDNS